jgi:hypothetical protein
MSRSATHMRNDWGARTRQIHDAGIFLRALGIENEAVACRSRQQLAVAARCGVAHSAGAARPSGRHGGAFDVEELFAAAFLVVGLAPTAQTE